MEILAAHDIQPKMSRVGNAKAESLMKALKQEEPSRLVATEAEGCSGGVIAKLTMANKAPTNTPGFLF